MTKEDAQYEKMTQGNTKKLVLSLGTATMISMLITAIYNIADTFFVSDISKNATAAVTVVFPLMAIIQAVGFTLGMGAGSLVSSALGEKRNEDAQIIGSSAFYGSVILGTIITVLCYIFMNPLMKLLGSTDDILPYARDYSLWIVAGFPLMAGSFVMNNLLRSEGKAKFAMIGLTTGGILNMILDPVLISGCSLGISGAAIATVISQAVSFTILLRMFLLKKSIIKLSIKETSHKIKVYGEIVKVGFPSLCRQGLASIATILLNNAAKNYGNESTIAAIGVTNKVVMIIFSMCLGIGQGYQPVCGYNYFAKKYDRVKEAMIFTFIFSFVAMTLVSLVCFIFAKQIITVFANSHEDTTELIEIGKKALRFQCISMPILSLNVIVNMTYQSTKRSVIASILSCCRQGLFFIPFVLILPLIFKLNGVILTQPISDICTSLFSVPFFIATLKDLNKKNKETIVESSIEAI